MVGDPGQRQFRDNIGRGNMQHRGLLELPQAIHLLLEIISGNTRQAHIQNAPQTGLVQRLIQGTGSSNSSSRMGCCVSCAATQLLAAHSCDSCDRAIGFSSNSDR